MDVTYFTFKSILVRPYIYHNSGHYPSFCLLFKTQLNSIGMSVPHKKHTLVCYEANRLMLSISLWRWYINIAIIILDIIQRPVFYLKLNSTQPNSIGLSVPHWKHITSPLRAKQVNVIYRFVTMVYYYNCHNSGHYPSYCLLYKTQPLADWVLFRLQVEPTPMGPIDRSSLWSGHRYINITSSKSTDLIVRPYLRHEEVPHLKQHNPS
jgi:hypothetical protein